MTIPHTSPSHFSQAELERINNCVVMIRRGGSTGAGFFVLPGLIATCEHVIESGTSAPPRVSWQDQVLDVEAIIESPRPETLDLALIKVRQTDHPLLPISPATNLFDTVYAFGYQYISRGYFGYPIKGELSGYALGGQGEQGQRLLVISEATVDQGSSGAPLFSLEGGHVVGIVKRSIREGGGYAVPIEEIDELREGTVAENNAIHPALALSPKYIGGYLQQLAEEHSYIAMVDLQRQVRLDEVFVSLTLAPQSITGAPLSLNVAGTLDAPDKSTRAKVDARRDLGSPQRHYRQAEVPLGEVLSQQAAIILGEPGAGKTTLLRHLLIRTCKGEINAGKVPVFIRLANLDPQAGGLRQYLESVYPEYSQVIYERTVEGGTVYFFDGLDEVDKSKHEIIRDEINRITANHNQVFITCRSAAFPKGLFSSVYRTFECVGFNAAQQRRFLLRWFAGQEDVVWRFQNQLETNVGARGLSQNPLLLSLMAIVFENDPEFNLPIHRAQLYGRVIDVLLERRERIQGGASIPRRIKLDMLAKLSLKFMLSGHDSIDEDDLLDWIEDYQAASSRSQIREVLPESIMERLVEHDGLLARETTSSLKFLHRTFQEYLAARYLARADNWKSVVSKRIGNPKWEEVVRLLGGILSKDSAEELVQLLWPLGSSVTQGMAVERLCLAARCASDVEALPTETGMELGLELGNLILESEIEPVVTEATLSLATMCGRHTEVRRGVFRWIKGEVSSRSGLREWIRYIEYLGLVDAEDSAVELLSILEALAEAGVADDENVAILVGAVLSSLGEVGRAANSAMVEQLVPLMHSESSFIAASASLAVANLRSEDSTPLIEQFLRSEEETVRVLAAYPLFRSLDSGDTNRILEYAFCERHDSGIQSLTWLGLDSELLEPDTGVAQKLLDCCKSDNERARCLSVLPSLAYAGDNSSLERRILDSRESDLLRCASLEVLSRLAPHRAADLLAQLFEADAAPSLIHACIAALVGASTNEAHGLLMDRVAPTSEGSLLMATLRLFTAVPSPETINWLYEVVEATTNTDVQLQALIALASLGSDNCLLYLQNYLALSPASHLRERVVTYQALGSLRSSEAGELIVDHLFGESDIITITHGIEALSEIPGTAAEEALLRCLDSHAWPTYWPPKQPPPGRGEQRPSDRRCLAAIIGLNKRGSVAALDMLCTIIKDAEEASEIRQAAYVAARTIAWNAGNFDLALPAY